jgi:hypothetical protein
LVAVKALREKPKLVAQVLLAVLVVAEIVFITPLTDMLEQQTKVMQEAMAVHRVNALAVAAAVQVLLGVWALFPRKLAVMVVLGFSPLLMELPLLERVVVAVVLIVALAEMGVMGVAEMEAGTTLCRAMETLTLAVVAVAVEIVVQHLAEMVQMVVQE